jgi:serine/threonine protein kinase
VLNLVTQALRTLAAMHRQGVVHRDVKPDACLGEDGVLRLLDWAWP